MTISLNASVEADLAHDINELRERFTATQDLYREVCGLLFFRYGITPTANKLYQLVKKGSMSAPAEALSRFWNELREKSRVHIEGPDLPDALRQKGGELLSELWQQAQTFALENFQQMHQEAQASINRAQAETHQARQETRAAQQAVNELHIQLDNAAKQQATLVSELHEARAMLAALTQTLQKEQQRQAELDQQLQLSQSRFAAELEKLHASAQHAEERTRSTEKRLLLEIDRERMAAIKLTRELDASRSALDHQHQHYEAQRNQSDAARKALETELSTLREQLVSAQQAARSTQEALNALETQHESAKEAFTQTRRPLARKPVPTSRVARRRRLGLRG